MQRETLTFFLFFLGFFPPFPLGGKLIPVISMVDEVHLSVRLFFSYRTRQSCQRQTAKTNKKQTNSRGSKPLNTRGEGGVTVVY